nr:MAG TPA: hypothetical protein [Caudoviricetes sp.]DAU44231.1 MAG TPA: hypothetical protein [Caudoviricetes sp.]
MPQSYGYKDNRTKNYVTLSRNYVDALALSVPLPRFFFIPGCCNELCVNSKRLLYG